MAAAQGQSAKYAQFLSDLSSGVYETNGGRVFSVEYSRKLDLFCVSLEHDDQRSTLMFVKTDERGNWTHTDQESFKQYIEKFKTSVLRKYVERGVKELLPDFVQNPMHYDDLSELDLHDITDMLWGVASSSRDNGRPSYIM